MRRSICYCEPSQVKAGDVSNWKFIFTTSEDLPKGTLLKFDLESEGRPTDWETPQINLNKPNAIWLEAPGKRVIKPKKVDEQFEFTLTSKVPSGKSVIINMGNPQKKHKKNRAQTYTQRKRKFSLYIDKSGKGQYNEIENFYLDVRGNVLKNMKLIVPSMVSKNKRFDVVVRFEDEFGNLTGNAEEGTLIDLSYQRLRENLSWKLFVPETGFITLPNIYFNEPGIYKINLTNLKTKETFVSSPIKCFADSEINLYWGTFHGESESFDATENIESCLRSFRDKDAIQFYSSSSFDSIEETPNDVWKKIAMNISEFNEDFRFSSFLGFQWVGTNKEEGVRQFIYLKDNKPILRKKDLKTNSLKKIYKIFQPKELIAIPTFTMGKDSCYDFKNYNKEFERVAEIYNAWGSSEGTNIKPIKGKCKPDLEGSLQKALNNNCRFGFIAGGLDDRGIYEEFYDSDQLQYTPGLTAITAKDQTKEELFSAIQKRSCYATTGERIILEFYIANAPMGTELTTATKPGLLFNRFIAGSVIGTTEIEKVEILRNGNVMNTFFPKKDQFDFDINDSDDLSKIAIGQKGGTPFVYYYLRVFQKDGHMAWGSPIWIDIEDKKQTKKVERT